MNDRIKDFIKNELRQFKLSDVSSKYGASMGRRNELPLDVSASLKLRLTRLKWVDGDYDQGGAYWGGGRGDWIFCAWGEDDEKQIRIFVRATNCTKAEEEVKKILPNAKFI
jgi:hypothetical protein